jgi:uncharacterized protein
MNIPRFVIQNTSNSQFRFNLIAANNEILLTSETYTALSSAKDGIAAVRTVSQLDTNFKRQTSVRNEPYFTLEAANSEVVGTSEMYSSAQARDNGIDAVKRVAENAEVVNGRG